MKITTLLNAAGVFNKVAQTKTSPKLAYKIMKFCKGAAAEEEFYESKRNEIINMYAVKDESGNVNATEDGMVQIMPEKIADANAAMLELSSIEVDKPNIAFTIDELSVFELSAADMFALDEFIEE